MHQVYCIRLLAIGQVRGKGEHAANEFGALFSMRVYLYRQSFVWEERVSGVRFERGETILAKPLELSTSY